MGTKRAEEFRPEAVRIALTSELTRKQVASDLNVGFSTLCKWIKRVRKTPEKPSSQSDLEYEVSEFRKEYRDKVSMKRLCTIMNASSRGYRDKSNPFMLKIANSTFFNFNFH